MTIWYITVSDNYASAKVAFLDQPNSNLPYDRSFRK